MIAGFVIVSIGLLISGAAQALAWVLEPETENMVEKATPPTKKGDLWDLTRS